jgi:hypothetical protein
MIIEIIQSRGTRIEIDGKRPEGDWGYGCNKGVLTPKTYQDGQKQDGISIGPHRILRLGVEMGPGSAKEAYRVFDIEGLPEVLVLETSNGDYRLPVTSVVCGDGSKLREVVMVSGEQVTIDEITLYVKAEGDISRERN